MRGDDISERLLDFAARNLNLAAALPKSPIGKHICAQLARSATSAGANYEEARGSESSKDFTHKPGMTLKELRETVYRLKVTERAEFIPSGRLTEILQEGEELCKIIAKSILTVRRKG